MLIKVRLAKVVAAILAAPARQGIANRALAYWLVVVIVLSRVLLRGLLLGFWLRLHARSEENV